MNAANPAIRSNHPRMTREGKTVIAMIELYCRKNHGSRRGLCPDCRDLLEYAIGRLDRCPYQEGKTTCTQCPVHCYKPLMREKIRTVMKFSGPRMILRHPVMAFFHIIDGRRKEPFKPAKRRRS
jgi:hypothetical protein